MAVIMLDAHRHAFAALAKPESVGDGEPAYGNRIIIDPKHADVKRIEEAILQAAKEKWKDDAEAILEVLYEDGKVCFMKKPYKSKKTGKVYDGFEGKYSLGTRQGKLEKRPTCFDQFGKKITDNDDIARVLYNGCLVREKVEFWAQDNSFGRRINCTPLGVMFAGDGDSFGGGAAPAGEADEDFAKHAQSADDLV